MRNRLLGLLALAVLLPAEELAKPDKLSIHTWVREDIFAGWMAKDNEALARGERKLDHYLNANPTDHNALAWKFLAIYCHMRDAYAKGDTKIYRGLVAVARKTQEKAFANSPQDAGPYIIIGGSLVMGAFYADPADREAMYREGRELLRKVPVIQAKYFHTLPPHMRGELWSLMAYASDRLGDKAERDNIIQQMREQLAGSPYEARAKRWLTLSELNSATDNMCISCHEPGRLKNVQARLNNTAAK